MIKICISYKINVTLTIIFINKKIMHCNTSFDFNYSRHNAPIQRDRKIIFTLKNLTITLTICIIALACISADMAQEVERILGKDEVTGSTPVISSKSPKTQSFRGFLQFT